LKKFKKIINARWLSLRLYKLRKIFTVEQHLIFRLIGMIAKDNF